MSGYVHCACRDCVEIAIASTEGERALCHACEDAGCEADSGECEAPHAYCDDSEGGACAACGLPF
jgi:hypothetical protein